jgi:hypothetical protein
MAMMLRSSARSCERIPQSTPCDFRGWLISPQGRFYSTSTGTIVDMQKGYCIAGGCNYRDFSRDPTSSNNIAQFAQDLSVQRERVCSLARPIKQMAGVAEPRPRGPDRTA